MLHKNMHPALAAVYILHNAAQTGRYFSVFQMSNTPRMMMPATTSAIIA